MTTLFLDLEKTIIHSWDDPVIINEKRITSVIRSFNPNKIGIYSFAIYDEKDLRIFKNSIQSELENALPIKIDSSLVFTVAEIADTILHSKDSDIKKFIQDYGKQKSFSEFIKIKYENGNFILIDDLVENLQFSNGNVNIQFVNPFLKVTT